MIAKEQWGMCVGVLGTGVVPVETDEVLNTFAISIFMSIIFRVFNKRP